MWLSLFVCVCVIFRCSNSQHSIAEEFLIFHIFWILPSSQREASKKSKHNTERGTSIMFVLSGEERWQKVRNKNTFLKEKKPISTFIL